jgi:hypothetical protein
MTFQIEKSAKGGQIWYILQKDETILGKRWLSN